MAISVPESDSTYRTTITLGGGSGRHGTGLDVYLGTVDGSGYGCEGTSYPAREVRRPVDLEERFIDIGGGIDHQLEGSKWHLGLRGGYVREEATLVGSAPINPLTNETVDISEAMSSYAQTSYWYVNPYVAIEGSKIGIGIGALGSQAPLRTAETKRIPEDLLEGAGIQPSFHFRLGPRDKFYVSYSLWEGIPIYSGGGMHNAGVGFLLGRHLDVWTGYAFGGPYRTDGMLVRATLGASSAVAVNISLRVPVDYQSADGYGSINEIGGSVGLQFRR